MAEKLALVCSGNSGEEASIFLLMGLLGTSEMSYAFLSFRVIRSALLVMSN